MQSILGDLSGEIWENPDLNVTDGWTVCILDDEYVQANMKIGRAKLETWNTKDVDFEAIKESLRGLGAAAPGIPSHPETDLFVGLLWLLFKQVEPRIVQVIITDLPDDAADDPDFQWFLQELRGDYAEQTTFFVDLKRKREEIGQDVMKVVLDKVPEITCDKRAFLSWWPSTQGEKNHSLHKKDIYEHMFHGTGENPIDDFFKRMLGTPDYDFFRAKTVGKDFHSPEGITVDTVKSDAFKKFCQEMTGRCKYGVWKWVTSSMNEGDFDDTVVGHAAKFAWLCGKCFLKYAPHAKRSDFCPDLHVSNLAAIYAFAQGLATKHSTDEAKIPVRLKVDDGSVEFPKEFLDSPNNANWGRCYIAKELSGSSAVTSWQFMRELSKSIEEIQSDGPSEMKEIVLHYDSKHSTTLTIRFSSGLQPVFDGSGTGTSTPLWEKCKKLSFAEPKYNNDWKDVTFCFPGVDNDDK